MLDSLKKADAERAAKLPLPPSPIPGQFVMPSRPFVTVDIADLPDYHPALRQGQLRADAQRECLNFAKYVDGSERWIIVRHYESEW